MQLFDGTSTVTESYDIGTKSDVQSATADCDAQAESLMDLGATNVDCNVSVS